MEGGIGGVEYPAGRRRRPPRRARQGAPARARAGPALENMTMTFNVLEYCRQTQTPIIFSSSREVYGDVHRFQTEEGTRRLRLRREHVLRLQDRRRGARLLLRPLLPASVHRLPLLERLRALRQRPHPDDPRDPALHPPDPARRADHRVRRQRQGARLHLRRRLCRGDRPGDHRARRGERAERDDQPRLRAGEHARPRRRADRRGDRQGARRDARTAVARRGDALRGRHRPRPRAARLGAERAARRRASRGASPGSTSGAGPTPRRTERSSSKARSSPRRRTRRYFKA